MEKIPVGTYVLGTKFTDGSPQDPWIVGFVAYHRGLLTYVTTAEPGTAQAGMLRGCRRVKPISANRGRWILAIKSTIEQSHFSLWRWLRVSMRSVKTPLDLKGE